ncbi:MAG: hypothetical protein Q4D20_00370 [Clostridia bacterium]|nr:hypothetical protein [Clostridia bacterium]
MKRIIISVFLLLFALCACSAKESPKSISLPEKEVSVTFKEGETKVSGIFFCESPQKMKLTLTEPENAKGFEISLCDSVYSISYDGVSCPIQNFENLFGSPKGIQTLFEAFSAMKEDDEEFSKSQQKITYPLGEAVVSFDENGNLFALRAGSYDFSFTDV